MSDRVLHAAQFFRGSSRRYQPGDLMESLHEHGDPYNYFSTDPEIARFYGDQVHRVEPTGRYMTDENEDNAFKSEHPLRVVGQHDFGGHPGHRASALDDAIAAYHQNRGPR